MNLISFFLAAITASSAFLTCCDQKQNTSSQSEISQVTSKMPLVNVSSIEEVLKIKDSLISFRAGYCEGFPSEVLQNPRVVEISMSFCNIPVVPDSISNLHELRSLIINHSGVQYIPESITRLKKLRFLSLIGNELDSIPEWICRFDTMQMINFRMNNIRHIPDCVKKKDTKTWLLLVSDKSGKDLRDW